MSGRVVGARKVAVNSTLDPRLLADVDAMATELEITRSSAITAALRLWLDTQRQEAEIDRNLARLAEERLADDSEGWVEHAAVKARAGL